LYRRVTHDQGKVLSLCIVTSLFRPITPRESTAAQSESRANQDAIAYSVFDGDRRRDKLTRRWPG